MQDFFYLFSETYSYSLENEDTFSLDVILYDLIALQVFFYVLKNLVLQFQS